MQHIQQCFEWCKHFYEGRESIEGDCHEGQPKSIITSEAMQCVNQVVLNPQQIRKKGVVVAEDYVKQ